MNTRTIFKTGALASLLALSTACGGSDPAPPTPEADAPAAEQPAQAQAPASKAEAAAGVADAIAADPGNASAILADAGFTRESFQALLVEIAADPDLSREYAAARN